MSNFENNIMSWGVKSGLRLEWLRAVAQGYNYSYNKIESGSNFQNNLMSWGINMGWGLDGCARWRKITVTVAVALQLS